jgi:signal transduction histidine kinase
LVIGYSLILDLGRKKIESEIAKENDVLRHEISIFEQKIWVFRKSWQLLLHGKVQAALTAALTRLSLPHNDNSVKLELVRQDLKRAETSLQNHPLRSIELKNSIEELSSTWIGVCDVKVSVSERATRALQRNFETMFSVNEIMREAVSNAVRHGSSTRVDIEIDRVEDEVIEFVCRNNGTLLSVQASQGLGSEMMDELTIEWSISTEAKSGLTALRARIPVSL